MSTTINSIEVESLSYERLRLLMDNDPTLHLEEVPFGSYQLELDLCHEVYSSVQELGYLQCYAVYVNKEYAGYMVVGASEMMHYKGHIRGIADSYYIKPEYRSSGAFSKLLFEVEISLKRNNIEYLTLGMNPLMPHYVNMMEYVGKLGYQTTEILMTKEL